MTLNTLLKMRGIKQKWLADNIGVSEVTVSNWCNGKSSPRSRNVAKISSLLGISENILTK